MMPISTGGGFLKVTDPNDFNGPAQTTNLVLASLTFQHLRKPSATQHLNPLKSSLERVS
jgi:hypothetical protein